MNEELWMRGQQMCFLTIHFNMWTVSSDVSTQLDLKWFKICVNNFVICKCSSKISIATDKIWVGHKITVGQWTMSPQKSSQKLYSLDMLTGYAHCTLVLEQTAKSSPVNLRFLPLCKNTNKKLHKDQLTIFPNILTGQKWDLTKQNFLWLVIVSVQCSKIILSPKEIRWTLDHYTFKES